VGWVGAGWRGGGGRVVGPGAGGGPPPPPPRVTKSIVQWYEQFHGDGRLCLAKRPRTIRPLGVE
jgi:hypothetical protein